MLRGFSTVTFYADNHAVAKEWYSTLPGQVPYFERPGYCEFRVGECYDEPGIIDAAFAPPNATGAPLGAIVYWHVADVTTALSTLLAAGGVRIPARHRPRWRLHHNCGSRSVRQHHRTHPQPAPRGA